MTEDDLFNVLRRTDIYKMDRIVAEHFGIDNDCMLDIEISSLTPTDYLALQTITRNNHWTMAAYLKQSHIAWDI